MKRRDVIVLLAGASLATPFVVRAQPSSKGFHIAFFPDFGEPVPGWLSADLRDHGWIEEQDFVIVQSGYKAGDPEQDQAAQRVVANRPDLIFTRSSAWALSLRRASASIPIVMVTSGYPVEAGLADSLAKPGRNVTGNSLYAGTGVWGKMLQLLRDAKPDIERVGVLWAYATPRFPKEEVEPCYAELNKGARSLGLKLSIVEVADARQIQSSLAEIEAERPEGLLLTTLSQLKPFSVATQFSEDRRLPTITDLAWAPDLAPSPLMSYGPVYRQLVRSAAATIDKIMRGSRPGDLPIQLPAKFELVISLKTANAIGLALPQNLLLQADKVLE